MGRARLSTQRFRLKRIPCRQLLFFVDVAIVSLQDSVDAGTGRRRSTRFAA
ncbi:hypothetical protein PLANPX_5010 [Lacipirellula parvula]|uniref:Uncharacterized protein n=1 Tax=Lacipirellula parvula TaxID=2650471 RepID=A0A5K7XFV6_9BACT|nr:hypothetical protein PLANPX_5010 [Lacipirellula parvula]